MHTKGPVFCKPHEVGTHLQIAKRKKWGNGIQNSGPCGYKRNPRRVLARAMAEIAATYRKRGKPSDRKIAA